MFYTGYRKIKYKHHIRKIKVILLKRQFELF